MKIAIFSDCYLDLMGGITTVIDADKAELEKRGHTVYVFSTGFLRSEKRRKKLAAENIYVVPTCKFFGKWVSPISRRPGVIEKWLEKKFPELLGFDVIYVHYEAGCSIAGLRFAKKHGIPSVQVMHGREDVGIEDIIPYGLRTFVARHLLHFQKLYLPCPAQVRRDDYLVKTDAAAKMWSIMVNHANYADVVLSPSQHFAKKLAHYGVEKDVIVLPNGVRDEILAPEVEVKKYDGVEPLRIVWHSRISSQKRMLEFLEALKLVRGKYEVKAFGGGGDYFRAKRYAKKNGLNVRFYNNTKFERVYQEISRSHLDVLVSYNFDTFGMTLIEAESAGVPTLIVDPNLAETVTQGGCVLADSPSVKGMADALNDLMEHPERIEKMSSILVKNRDSIRASGRVDKLEKIFREAVAAMHKKESEEK